jgi:uncharacterized protein (UPF0216 family)
MSGWRKRQVIEMAREAGAVFPADGSYHKFERHEDLEAFAALVRADERSRTWTPSEWTEYEHSIAAQEREACAMVCEELYESWINIHGRYEFMGEGAQKCADVIRARGQA